MKIDGSAARGRLKVFAYLDTDKSAAYRTVMGAFLAAKARFGLHLRPDDVARETALDIGEVDAALKQLREWGNLRADPDTADVATIEEFYKERLLYQLTRDGEAAERAVAHYHALVVEPGELQTSALTDVREYLLEITGLLESADPDAGKLHRAFSGVRERFEELTSKAQIFMGSLQRAVDLHGADEEVFIAYKDRLIDYLDRFVRGLVVACIEIGALIRQLEPQVPRAIVLIAEREAADRLDLPGGSTAAAIDAWQARWAGVRSWFIGAGTAHSQSEILRARARAAIPALLGAAQAMHDRRLTRTDRHHDFRTLARWFAAAPDDRAAHRLWRAAFALGPARHLWVNDESRDEWDRAEATPRTSWLDAPPLRIAPRLRLRGRYDRPGAPRGIVDRSAARAALAEIAAKEHAQLEMARQRFLLAGRTRLSTLGALDRREFDLLLDLLADVLSTAPADDGLREGCSSDGALRILLVPTKDGARATIATEDGTLHCADHFFEVTDALALPPAEAAQ